MGKNDRNTFAKSNKTNEELLSIYERCKKKMEYKNDSLDAIFRVILLDKERLFPNQKKDTEEECIMSWIKKYKRAIENPPSKRKGNPKRTCDDPALAAILKNVCGIDDGQASVMQKYHNILMQAENIQGELLEEYIAGHIEPLGWIWCAGTTVSSVDFCKKDGKRLLQFKSKDNTENSSSIKIRNGTTIDKLNRLKTRFKYKKPYADYEWDKINAYFNQKDDSADSGAVDDVGMCDMSEEGYMSFIENVIKNNPGIIYVG